jgi:predicted XRE-type DNA-binding protein
MGRSLDDVIAALPPERQEKVETRFQELKQQVEGLGELRRVAGKAQAEIASALKIKQPSVSKIERQADLYLSTLRNYIEAIGGKLDLVVRLPSRPPIHLEHLGDVVAGHAVPVKRGVRAPVRKGRRPGRAAAARA